MAAELFTHCRGATEAWATFHEMACMCHPAQGGSAEDMEALCGAARVVLGAEWPAGWPAAGNGFPNMFDIHCVSSGTPNPFGAGGIAIDAPAAAAYRLAPSAFDPSASPFEPLTGVGRISLAWAAASST